MRGFCFTIICSTLLISCNYKMLKEPIGATGVGKLDESSVQVESDKMPNKSEIKVASLNSCEDSALSAEQVEFVRRWLDAGHPEN